MAATSRLRPGLTVSALGLGGAPLSSMPEVLGYEVPKDRAVLLVEAVLAESHHGDRHIEQLQRR